MSAAGRVLPGISYRQKIMIVILVFTLIPILASSIYLAVQYLNGKKDQYIDANRKELEKAARMVNDLYYSGIVKSNYLKNNLQIIQMLRQDYSFDLVSYLTNINTTADIIDALESDSSRHMIRLYAFNDSVFTSERVLRGDLLDENIVEELLSLPGNGIIWKPVMHSSGNGFDMRLYNKIMDIDKPLAVTEIVLPFESIAAPLQYDVPDGGFVVYKSHAGQIVPLDTGTMEPSEALEISGAYFAAGAGGHPDYIAVTFPVELPGDEVLVFISDRNLWDSYRFLMIAGLAAMLVLLATIYFSVRAVAVVLTNRLAKLMKRIHMEMEVVGGEEASELPARGDEFAIMERKFNQMIHRIKDHYRATADYELEKERLRMEIMQVHINPHFLYNTLSAIKWTYDDPKLHRLIDEMVVYFRIFLNRGNSALPIGSEVSLIRKYLEIQKFSYDSDLTYAIEVDQDIEHCPILKNLLQPIVENSILHGINGLEAGGGNIVVSVRKQDDRIELKVEDNGVGMEQAKAERLLRGDGRGFGLTNVQKRLHAYYGPEHGLRMQCKPEGGVIVTFTIPYVPQGNP